jgi:hypothetical protein
MKTFLQKNKHNKAEYQLLKKELQAIGIGNITVDFMVKYKEYTQIKLFLYKNGYMPLVPEILEYLKPLVLFNFKFFFIKDIENLNDKVVLNLIFI